MNSLARRTWAFEPGWHYLNHGSYGACPRPVLAAQGRWRKALEAQPVRFMDREAPPALRAAAAALGRFVGARGEDVVFVDNATAAANAVLRAQPWRTGDRVVLSSHVYPSVRNAAERLAAERGFKVVVAKLPARVRSEEDVLEAYERALGPRTRLVVVEHIASASALVFPARALCRLARAAGARVFVDGAHAPGQVDVDLAALGADYWTGNAHKWLCAPKGCAVLWARRAVQDGLLPPVTSTTAGRGFTAEFDYAGTRDPSAYLAVTEALSFHRRLGGARLRARNRALAWEGGSLAARRHGLEVPSPRALYAAMVPMVLPARL
ncbi:MAG: aminotransferase class V-fold PLP-dependent enzyme, partial [Elusimicrobia bacterium]|nr:aminotransferase class V-fold PLP-dependent enzyme [Elusimicrobiota bacterium]